MTKKLSVIAICLGATGLVAASALGQPSTQDDPVTVGIDEQARESHRAKDRDEQVTVGIDDQDHREQPRKANYEPLFPEPQDGQVVIAP